MSKRVPTTVIKKQEFNAFLKAIEYKQAAHWVDIARAVGVTQDTITAWKKLPEAQEAIARGMQKALDDMEAVGRKDWRMHYEKYKLLSTPQQQAENINFIVAILNKYGGTRGGGVDDLPGTVTT